VRLVIVKPQMQESFVKYGPEASDNSAAKELERIAAKSSRI